MTNNFAKIFFMPVCSNCGRVLNGDVEYRSGIDYAMIAPSICPHCGCAFESIVMPNPTNSGIFHYDKTIYEHYSEISKGDYI